MSIENNEKKIEEEVVAPKQGIAKCRFKVFSGVFIAAFAFDYVAFTSEDIAVLFSLLITIIAFILLSICTHKVIQSKNYSLVKKIGVWIWDSFISLLIIGIAFSGAEQFINAIHVNEVQNMELHCDTQDVQVNISHQIENILIKNNLITLKNAENMKITLSDIQELKRTNEDKVQTLECRARVKISQQDNDLIAYTIDYNASLNTKGRAIKFRTNIVLLDPSL